METLLFSADVRPTVRVATGCQNPGAVCRINVSDWRGGWVIDIPGAGVTQASTFSEVPPMTVDYLRILDHPTPEYLDIVVSVDREAPWCAGRALELLWFLGEN